MMFNGLLMCADSDTSDLARESGASSLQDAGSGTWDSCAHATYQKLVSTLQILANKEETVRVQGESLRVAEARIASLTARAQRLQTELDQKAQELKALRSSEKRTPEKMDISMATDDQEVKNQKHIVNTLQTNLSVIEDLYRECFYEVAKQEEMIEMLRQSYLDVRLMDRQKRDQIGRLLGVVDAQKWSLERCQDMAVEVEGLKLEISNFLSSSNNDSGMWERSDDSLSEEVTEDLQQIAAQLLQLRTMLTGDCTCGLQEENMRLKNQNETMQIEMGELRQRVSELESALSDKENTDQTYRDDVAEKEQELNNVRRRLAELKESAGDKKGSCDVLAARLQQIQGSLEDQTRELIEAQQRCEGHEATINQLSAELARANRVIEEGRVLREEVGEMRRSVCESGRRMRVLADELTRAHDHCRTIDASYREKAHCAAKLQSQLEDAHARGAALCEEVQRVVCAVQRWMRRMRARHREQESKIKQSEALISSLKQGNESHTTDPCCTKCLSLGSRRASSRATETDRSRDRMRKRTDCKCAVKMAERERIMKTTDRGSCSCSLRSKGQLDRAVSKTVLCECPSKIVCDGARDCVCNLKARARSKSSGSEIACECSREMEKEGRSRTSGSEMASCSSAPTPPRRLLKKEFSPSNEKVESWWCGGRDGGASGRSRHARCLRVDAMPVS